MSLTIYFKKIHFRENCSDLLQEIYNKKYVLRMRIRASEITDRDVRTDPITLPRERLPLKSDIFCRLLDFSPIE